VKDGLRAAFSGWIEAGRKIGFFLLLAAGSAGLGFLIAWPLWLFATTARSAYTIAVLAAGGAGILVLVVRAARRRRRSVRDPGTPARSALSVLLAVVTWVIGLAGVYLAAALFIRGLWIVGAAVAAVWAGLLWLLARARRAVKVRKVRPVPAENGSE
jgi:hypothetical protein